MSVIDQTPAVIISQQLIHPLRINYIQCSGTQTFLEKSWRRYLENYRPEYLRTPTNEPGLPGHAHRLKNRLSSLINYLRALAAENAWSNSVRGDWTA